jgi:hypothetical protein
MFLIKVKTALKITRTVNNVEYVETQTSSASNAIVASTATLPNINKAILKAVNNSNTSAFTAGIPIATGVTKLGDGSDTDQTQTDIVSSSGSSLTPWSGGVLNGYFMWQGNFVNSSPITQYFAYTVSAAQTSTDTTTSNIVPYYAAYNYTSNVTPPGLDVSYNAIFMFSGNSNVQSALDSNVNYTTGTNNYNTAVTYLLNNNIPEYLLSLTIGGGYNLTGSWNTGSAGAMYSLYQTVTKAGVTFNYTETGTGIAQSGLGTGTLFPIVTLGDGGYNSICLDIETWGAGLGDTTNGSTGQDFLNVCQYIKTNITSTFASTGCVIIVTVAHSCSNYNGTGLEMMTTILSDTTACYDYMSPQLYTQNIGTTNEYTQNSNLTWSQFYSYLSVNTNYQTYGSGFLLPALNFLGLLNDGGSNNNNSPNLYWYEDSTSSTNPPVFSPAVSDGSAEPITNYTVDTGAENFLNAVFNQTAPLGGSIQWVNGTIKPGVIEYPYPWSKGQVIGQAMWNNNFASNTVNYYNGVTSPQSVNGPSNLTVGQSNFTYSNTPPTGTNVIHIYTELSNAQSALNYSGYDNANPFVLAYQSIPAGGILSLALGSATSYGYWNTTSSGAVYSVYAAVTKKGVFFSYTETDTGGYMSGTGTGTLNNSFNGLLFDIESYDTSNNGKGSSGQDFINLFQYIKYNPNSNFYQFQMLITVAFPHTGPYYNGNGGNLMSTILADATGNQTGNKFSYDWLAPKLFTGSNIGQMNEYCSGYKLPWTGSNSFLSYLQQNTNFTTFNVNMITPFLISGNLLNGPGSNTSGYPNNYWAQSNSTSDSTPTSVALGDETINYTTDTGSTTFFNTIFQSGVTSTGGYVQWMNGTLK